MDCDKRLIRPMLVHSATSHGPGNHRSDLCSSACSKARPGIVNKMLQPAFTRPFILNLVPLRRSPSGSRGLVIGSVCRLWALKEKNPSRERSGSLWQCLKIGSTCLMHVLGLPNERKELRPKEQEGVFHQRLRRRVPHAGHRGV